MFSDRIFHQCWLTGFNENIGTFKINDAMLNQKYQEENGKEEENEYKTEVCIVPFVQN